MGDLLAVAIGLSLAAAIAIALVVWRKRRDRYSTPAARYLRDVSGIRMDTYQQVKGPGYTRQAGDPPGYVGGLGPPASDVARNRRGPVGAVTCLSRWWVRLGEGHFMPRYRVCRY
jgi:hypothetical protein